jgi:hypothetical protein
MEVMRHPNVGWRVLNITPDNQRRNALFQDSLSLHSYKYLMFASMPDIQPDEFLTAVWLRGHEFPKAKAGLDHGVGHFRSLSITRQRRLLAYHGIAVSHEVLCQVF